MPLQKCSDGFSLISLLVILSRQSKPRSKLLFKDKSLEKKFYAMRQCFEMFLSLGEILFNHSLVDCNLGCRIDNMFLYQSVEKIFMLELREEVNLVISCLYSKYAVTTSY